jgi:hypothetical protein
MTPEALIAEIECLVHRGNEAAAIELVERVVTFELERSMSRDQRTRLHALVHPIHEHLGLDVVTSIQTRVRAQQAASA